MIWRLETGWLSIEDAHTAHTRRLDLRHQPSRQSGQPTLIQLSDGLKFRILVQQRCLAKESRRGDPSISNGKRMGCLNPGGLEEQDQRDTEGQEGEGEKLAEQVQHFRNNAKDTVSLAAHRRDDQQTAHGTGPDPRRVGKTSLE